MSISRLSLGGVAAVALLGLFACDNGPSAVQTRERDPLRVSYQEEATGPSESDRNYAARGRSDRASQGDRSDDRSDRRSRASGGIDWAASRQHSAADNARYQFRRDGAAFGANSVEDFVTRANAFVDHPPRGALKIERRNGDVLLYDPKANIFAVADKSGAPKTMFKPREGRAYWDEQVARQSRQSNSSSRRDD